MKLSVKFSYRCQKRRLQFGLTRQELADKAGVSVSCVSGFENITNSPSIDNFLKIFKALKLEFCFLDLDYVEPKPTPEEIVEEKKKISKREELEGKIQTFIDSGVRGDEQVGFCCGVSGSYIKQIMNAAGIKYPPKPKSEKKQVRKNDENDLYETTQRETGQKVISKSLKDYQ